MKTLFTILAAAVLLGIASLKAQTINFRQRMERAVQAQSPRDTALDGHAAQLQRYQHYWRDALDASGSTAGYAQYFAKKFTTAPLVGPCANTVNNCTDPCFDHEWRYLGPENISPNIQVNGRVECIWVNPANENHLRIGAKGGMWETTNNGSSWRNLTDVAMSGNGVFWIESPTGNPQTIYISTGVSALDATYGCGIWKSTDGGSCWSNLNVVPQTSLPDGFSNKIIVHPGNANILYVLMGHEIYKSLNAGATWTAIFRISDNPAKLLLKDIEIVPNGTNDDLYVTSQTREPYCYGTNNCLNLSPPCPSPFPYFAAGPTNTYCDLRYTAQVWRVKIPRTAVISSIPPVNLVPSLPGYPKNTTCALVSVAGATINICAYTETAVKPGPGYYPNLGAKVFRKVGLVTGSSFSFLCDVTNTGLNPPGCTFDASPSNPNTLYFGGLTLIKKLVSGTETVMYPLSGFVSNSNVPHPDIRCLKIYSSTSSGTGDKLFLGNDGGVSKTVNGGVSYSNLNGTGLQLTDVWGISNSETYPNYVACGVQDFGAFYNKQHVWNWAYLGDGYDAATGDVDPMETVVASTGYRLSKCSGSGTSPTTISGTLPSTSAMSMALPHELCPDGNNGVYFGSEDAPQGLYHYDFSNGSVTQVVGNFPNSNGKITGLALTKNGSNAYVGFNTIGYGTASTQGILFHVANPASSAPVVTDLTAGFTGNQWAGLTDIAIEPVSGSKVWCSFGGICCPVFKVMLYENGTWTTYGQGLPNIPASSIVYLEGSNDLLFVGTAEGVYYRDASMTQWAKFSCGLPGVPVTDLEINYRLRLLRAATYGRGIWQTEIPTK